MRQLLAVVNFPHSLSATGFGEREYTYKTYIEDLKPKNLLVVETQTGFSVARFVRYIDSTEIENLKYIVQRVNIRRHNQLKALSESTEDHEGLLD